MGGEVSRRQGGTLFPSRQFATPWWLLIIIVGGAFVIYSMLQEEQYIRAFTYLLQGVGKTVYLAVVSYAIALVLGLIVGLGRVSRTTILYTAATVYVEVIRGVPLLVIILYSQFVVAPALGTNRYQDISAVIALSVGYGAYVAEVYRAGIESLERGQMEAGRALGLSYFQCMRFIILPQAIRRVLPPLGNDFVAMIKDSALVSALGVQDITQLGKVYSASTFLFFETYNVVAFLYLVMTLSLSLLVRGLEARLKRRA